MKYLQNKRAPMPDIFKFTNFRLYLKAAIKAIRKIQPKFSYRKLAKQLDLTTQSHVLLIVQGKRNLTSQLSLRLSNYLKLPRKQMYYFEHMINYNQASTELELKEYYQRMTSLNPRLRKKKK
jgi:uncharacterized protein (TIGR02147 family)